MLKPLSSLAEPDKRLRDLVCLDHLTGQMRPVEIGDIYAMVEALYLPENVPQDVRWQFDTARHAFIYSWFCSDLATLEEAHAYGALENGLRLKAKAADVKPERSGMKGFLKLAIQKEWLPNAEFGHLVEALPELRNHVQHGQPHLNPTGSLQMIKACHGALMHLFLL